MKTFHISTIMQKSAGKLWFFGVFKPTNVLYRQSKPIIKSRVSLPKQERLVEAPP